ncbi:MAG: carboxypeptidase regulatory-like domain-containing protein [Planctomycetota bacterium]
MSRLLPVAILLLAVLGGLFFLLPDDQGPQGSGDPGEFGSTPTAAETLEAGDMESTGPTPVDGLTRAELDHAGVGGDAGSVAATGASRVSLMLIGPDGKPADGAMVEASEQQETDVPGFMLFDEEGEQRRPTHRADAVNGRVDLALAAGTAWRLDIKGSRWAPESLRVGSLAAGEQVDLGRVVLQQADRLEGEVVDAAGRPVSGARLMLTESGSSLFDGGGNVRVAYAEPDGRFHFDGVAAGRYKLEGRAAGHADGSLEPVVVAGEGGVAQAVLSLGAGRSVRGVVLDADNRPVPDAVIFPAPPHRRSDGRPASGSA